jgi:hypothetical protein
MLTPSGQYKGYSFRSFGSAGYEGGYSDVCIFNKAHSIEL